MTRKKRRTIRIAGYLTAGAMLLQFGQACTIANSVGTAGVASSGLLIDNNGYFLGLVNVCGQENIQLVDPDGVQTGLLNSEDDLMYGCPARQVETTGG